LKDETARIESEHLKTKPFLSVVTEKNVQPEFAESIASASPIDKDSKKYAVEVRLGRKKRHSPLTNTNQSRGETR